MDRVGRLETPCDVGRAAGLGNKNMFFSSRQCEVCIAFSLSEWIICQYHYMAIGVVQFSSYLLIWGKFTYQLVCCFVLCFSLSILHRAHWCDRWLAIFNQGVENSHSVNKKQNRRPAQWDLELSVANWHKLSRKELSGCRGQEAHNEVDGQVSHWLCVKSPSFMGWVAVGVVPVRFCGFLWKHRHFWGMVEKRTAEINVNGDCNELQAKKKRGIWQTTRERCRPICAPLANNWWMIANVFFLANGAWTTATDSYMIGSTANDRRTDPPLFLE